MADGGVLALSLPPDVDRVALETLLPGVDLEALTPDTAVILFQTLLGQALELDDRTRTVEEYQAEVERKDVELDQAYQDREGAVKDLEANVDALQRELKHVKDERDALLASQAALQTQLASVSDTHATSSTELQSLKHRINDVEREKRDLVAVVSRHKEDAAQRDEEISTLRSNLKTARQEHLTLESQLREARSNETSTRFKIDSLTQQLELARAESERATSDLATKTDEFAQYRRARHSEQVTLQTSFDTATQDLASTKSTLAALQTSHSAQTHQLTQALARVQALTNQLAEQDATYSQEAAGLKRLVKMLEDRENSAKAIVERIEGDWAAVNERTGAREAVLREEVEEATARAQKAEKQVQHLNGLLRRMESGELQLPGTGGSMPGTPAFGTPARNASFGDGMFGLSPTVALASRTQKSGKTFTEVYSEYVKLQEEFAQKSVEYEHMEVTLSNVLAQIEERAPMLAQQRAEFERSQQEANTLANQLSQALAERDGHAAASKDNAQRIAALTRENNLMNKQLDDLGRQVRTLARDIARRDDPTIPSDEELDADTSIIPCESTEELITNNLVLFKSIDTMQQQNQRLLKIVRELGDKLEHGEGELRKQLEEEQDVAVQEAVQAINHLEKQLELQKANHESALAAASSQIESYRTMLARAGQSAPTQVPTAGSTGQMDVDDEASRKLAEMKEHFEAYDTEMGEDTRRLREEVIAHQRDVLHLQSALKKAEAKVDVVGEHHRILQEQHTLFKREHDELLLRHQKLQLQYARAEMEYNRAADDLLGAHGENDQLRNECANLRAEKRIWAGVEGRLVEENKALALERSRLSDLMANVQRMHNDLERSGENDRRRLESQLENMQSQIQDMRTQLSQERETIRGLNVQREVDTRALQAKLDRTTEEYAKTRESLVGAETSKKHLEQRVEDLGKQLQGNQEKLSVYEHRTPHATTSSDGQTNGDAGREQQLEYELAELRKNAKMLEVDLNRARQNVQQFQAISATNEEALASLGATHETYKAEAEGAIARLQAELSAAKDKAQFLEQELSQVNVKIAGIQQAAEADRQAWLSDKRELENTIVDMTTSEKNIESDRVLQSGTTRELEERAKSSEERYSREVVAHADSIKTIDFLRTQLKEAQESSRTNAAVAETAQAKFVTSESSWNQQRAALEKEISDLGDRCKDFQKQNTILHEHLESVSNQAARIRQAASDNPDLPNSDGSDGSEQLAELRSVVTYLRKEKEIVDLQLELAKQENTRFKSQIDHLNQELAQTRETLTQERASAVQAATSEAQHAELVERINQLTILRESNATLRAEYESQAQRARELDTRLKQVTSELDPIKEQVRGAQAEIEARDAQIERLEKESAAWQERNRQLLSKYDRIDPAEMQTLKDEIERVKAEKAAVDALITELQQQVATATQRIETLETEKRGLVDTGRRNNEIFKKRMAAATQDKTQAAEAIAALQARVDALQAEHEGLTTQMSAAPMAEALATLTAQVETLIREKSALEKSLAEATAVAATGAVHDEANETITRLSAEIEQLKSEAVIIAAAPSEGAPAIGTSTADVDVLKAQFEAEKKELVEAREKAQQQTKSVQMQAQKAIISARNSKAEFDQLQAQLQELEKQKAEIQERLTAAEAATAAQPKAEPVAGHSTEELTQQHQVELTALETRLKTEHEQALQAAVEAARAAAPPADAPAGTYNEEDIAAAVERGRKELGAKLKIKDSQIANLQAKLKKVEQQMLDLTAIEGGDAALAKPTAASTSAAGAAGAAAGAKPIARKLSMPVAANGAPAPGAVAAATRASAAGTAPAPAALARGRGRGRGAAPAARGGGVGRGAAPATAAGSAPATAPSLTIAGAAAKRAREEGGETAADTLAKRLKPTDGLSKPVGIRRPPPPAS